MTTRAAITDARARAEEVARNVMAQLEIHGWAAFRGTAANGDGRKGALVVIIASCARGWVYIECRARGVRRTRAEAVQMRRFRANGAHYVAIEDAAVLPNLLHLLPQPR